MKRHAHSEGLRRSAILLSKYYGHNECRFLVIACKMKKSGKHTNSQRIGAASNFAPDERGT